MLSFILLHVKDFIVVQRGCIVTLCPFTCLYVSVDSNGAYLVVHIDVLFMCLTERP